MSERDEKDSIIERQGKNARALIANNKQLIIEKTKLQDTLNSVLIASNHHMGNAATEINQMSHDLSRLEKILGELLEMPLKFTEGQKQHYYAMIMKPKITG